MLVLEFEDSPHLENTIVSFEQLEPKFEIQTFCFNYHYLT